ncbi:MAG: hypothetical protein COZ50_14310 [Zetaproteobacteria bacterium CG_4_10_14_3_um_filter_54_28]|nr:MAG: hypothetical protein COZ50_14310 [Zetaproteobacteria bacterium CG_4_10_14_3_um_filter_54_28]
MFRKYIFAFIASLMLLVPQMGVAQAADAHNPAEENAQSLLAAFASYTDLRLLSIQQSLEILASTTAAKSLTWERVEPLLRGYQESDGGLIVWFARPDGIYFTVDKGKVEKKLSDRSYFPALISGEKIDGELVVSKSTGKRSVVVAVPVIEEGKVVGAIGASVILDTLAEQVSASLALPSNISFFALAPSGLTALHKKTEREFLDPRELGSETLKKAANEMLTNPAGVTSYMFDNVTKKAVYRSSPLTQWKFVIVFQ